MLADFGLTAFVKTSGNRGLHVFAPIQPAWEFLEVRHAVIAAARELERRMPEQVTTHWWKEERGERIFVDFNQANRDRTMAGAYSPRALAGATVSTPVSWEELEPASILPRSPCSRCRSGWRRRATRGRAMHSGERPRDSLLAQWEPDVSNGGASCRSLPTSRRCRASRRACSRRGRGSPTDAGQALRASWIRSSTARSAIASICPGALAAHRAERHGEPNVSPASRETTPSGPIAIVIAGRASGRVA